MLKKIAGILASLTMAVGLATTPTFTASAAASISVDLPADGVADGATAPIPVTVSGVTFAQLRVDVEASNGTVEINYSSASIEVTPGFGNTDSGSAISGESISFSAARADAVSLLASHLTFTSTETGGVSVRPELTIKISEYGVIVNRGNGHTYVYSGTFADAYKELSWQDAQAHAATTSRLGHVGYLTNITSDAENTFIKNESGIENVWIGATDDPTEVAAINLAKGLPVYTPVSGDSQTNGHMVWGAGSEKGQVISNGLVNAMQAANGSYENWATGEPNNASGSEGCGVTNWQDVNGEWNDLDCSRTEFYMVEYDTSLSQAPVPLTYDSTDALANTGGDMRDYFPAVSAAFALILLGAYSTRKVASLRK
jgi:hypothetical protein